MNPEEAEEAELKRWGHPQPPTAFMSGPARGYVLSLCANGLIPNWHVCDLSTVGGFARLARQVRAYYEERVTGKILDGFSDADYFETLSGIVQPDHRLGADSIPVVWMPRVLASQAERDEMSRATSPEDSSSLQAALERENLRQDAKQAALSQKTLGEVVDGRTVTHKATLHSHGLPTNAEERWAEATALYPAAGSSTPVRHFVNTRCTGIIIFPLDRKNKAWLWVDLKNRKLQKRSFFKLDKWTSSAIFQLLLPSEGVGSDMQIEYADLSTERSLNALFYQHFDARIVFGGHKPRPVKIEWSDWVDYGRREEKHVLTAKVRRVDWNAKTQSHVFEVSDRLYLRDGVDMRVRGEKDQELVREYMRLEGL